MVSQAYFRLLEFFKNQEIWTISQLAEMDKIHKTTAYKTLKHLEKDGLIFSFTIEGKLYTMWKNEFKVKPTQPDYKIYEAEPLKHNTNE